MKIVVIGGTGRLGSKVVDKLGITATRRWQRHLILASTHLPGRASPRLYPVPTWLLTCPTRLHSRTIPRWSSSQNRPLTWGLPRRPRAVRHYVGVSIVGADQLPKSGYLRAKVAQEKLIEASEIPYSIVRATQFAEFTDAITASMTVGDEVRVPDALIQPIAAEDSQPRSPEWQKANHWVASRTSEGLRRSRSSRWPARSWPGKAKPRPSSSTPKLVTSGHRSP